VGVATGKSGKAKSQAKPGKQNEAKGKHPQEAGAEIHGPSRPRLKCEKLAPSQRQYQSQSESEKE